MKPGSYASNPADLSTLCVWPTCNLEPLEPPKMPLCKQHVLKAFRFCQDVMRQATPDQLRELPVKDAGPEMEDDLRQRVREAHSVVYYAAIDNLIKIGTTFRLAERMNVLGGNLIATEPGGRQLESQRHKQFAHLLRKGREYFHPGHDLLTHVVSLQIR